MAGPEQIIKTALIPERGIELSPEFIEQSTVGPDFLRVFAHLIAKSPDRGVFLQATSDGSLKVVAAGVPFEYYSVFSGTGQDAYAAPNIISLDDAYNVTDLLIETHPAIVSFRNLQGAWLDDKTFPVGFHSIDFIHYGYKIRNRDAGNNTVFEITIYH